MTNAYVTLLYSASYLPGALVLGQSLIDNQCHGGKRVVLIPKEESLFTNQQLSLLSEVYDEIIKVDLFETNKSLDLINLNIILKRPELVKTLTKLQVFQLSFDKILYIDSDILIKGNLDHLFETSIKETEILAAPDAGWPDIFNTGLFLIKPSIDSYKDILKIIKESINSSFDGADQGFLNEFFQKFGVFNKEKIRNWKPLSFLYNVTPTKQYQYNPAYQRFFPDIKALHFIGAVKPWMNKVPFVDVARIENNGDYYELTKLWWSIFYRYYGDNADTESICFKETLNSFEDYIIPKFDLSTNFAALTVEELGEKQEEEEEEKEEEEVKEEEEQKELKDVKPKGILDIMFHESEPEREFSPDTLYY